jgi:hypothetical protein
MTTSAKSAPACHKTADDFLSTFALFLPFMSKCLVYRPPVSAALNLFPFLNVKDQVLYPYKPPVCRLETIKDRRRLTSVRGKLYFEQAGFQSYFSITLTITNSEGPSGNVVG